MKIRTDFVTNSSSYSSASIVIDNPVLLEILQKYKDKGAFEDSPFEIGNYGESCWPPDSSSIELSRELIKTPAFYYYEGDGSFFHEVPERLGDVLKIIISYLNGHLDCDEDLLKQILTELDERREDIKSAYKQVVWVYATTSNDKYPEDYNGYIDETYLFKFDPEKGEEYYYSRAAGEGSDEEIAVGYIFFEEHKVNGEDVASKDVDEDKHDAG